MNPKVLRAKLLRVEEDLQVLQAERHKLKTWLQTVCPHPQLGQHIDDTYSYMEHRVCLDCGKQESYGSYRLFSMRGLYDENTYELTEDEFYRIHRP